MRSKAELGARLPTDYKEICEAFGKGEFNGCLEVFSTDGGTSLKLLDHLASVRRSLEMDPLIEEEYLPYRLFVPGQGGLLQWGGSVPTDQFYWLTETDSPENWSVLARAESDPWHRYDMSMSEFLYRSLMDQEFDWYSSSSFEDRPIFELY